MSNLTKQTYRHVLKAIRNYPKDDVEVLSRVNPHLWGRGAYLDVDVLKDRRREVLDRYEIPYSDEMLRSRSVEKCEVLRFARERFRSGEKMNVAEMFSALRFFEEQKMLRQRISVKTTRNIRCVISTECLGVSEDVNNADNAEHYVFAYNVLLENVGYEQVTLHGRHLIFEDSSPGVEPIEVPKGSPGVVGLTPNVFPGTIFEYGSGVHLQSDSGFVSGSFQLSTTSGESFDAFMGPVSLLPRHL